MFDFRSDFPRRTVKDRLLRKVKVAGYVVTVLVPELAVVLIKKNMKVCDETARQILQDSARLG